MPSNELLERIDANMARGNELIEELRIEIQLSREAARRHELAFQDFSKMSSESIDALREVKADLRELGAEVRAHTEAIFRMLDRFDGGAEPATG